MRNRERIQRAFQPLKPDHSLMPALTQRGARKPRLAVVLALVLLVIGTVAYATDTAGLRTTLRLWLNGERRSVTLEQVDNTFILRDGNGQVLSVGGGVTETAPGIVRPLSAGEYAAHLERMPVAERDEDGRIWLCLDAQRLDITEALTRTGQANITLESGVAVREIQVRLQDDGSISVAMTGVEEE